MVFLVRLRQNCSHFVNASTILWKKLGYQGNDDHCFLVERLMELLLHTRQTSEDNHQIMKPTGGTWED
jgi:hypothetical protein